MGPRRATTAKSANGPSTLSAVPPVAAASNLRGVSSFPPTLATAKPAPSSATPETATNMHAQPTAVPASGPPSANAVELAARANALAIAVQGCSLPRGLQTQQLGFLHSLRQSMRHWQDVASPHHCPPSVLRRQALC